MMRNWKKKLWRYIFWIALIGCIGCFIFVGLHYWNSFRSEQEYESLREQMEGTAGEIETSVSVLIEEKEDSGISYEEQSAKEIIDAPGEITEKESSSELMSIQTESEEFTGIIDAQATEIPDGVLTDAVGNPVDFEKLQEINPELYAWVRVPNTAIDYPVAQHQGEDQEFYLHRDMYGNSQYAGCIYTENLNRMDFTDPVTVLYGHNMKNGSMFQNLHYFLDAGFFEENKYIYIYIPGKTLIYEIFSAYPYDDRKILTSFDFRDEEVLEKYLEECQHPRSMEALTRDEIEINTNSKIITLSTCIAGQTDQRLLVQAVLLYEENE